MDGLPLVIASGFALAAAALARSLASLALAVPPVATPPEPLPTAVRLVLGPARVVGHHVDRWLPVAWREGTLRRLRRAELDRHLGPGDWLGVQVAYGLLAAAAGLAVGAALDTPVVPWSLTGAAGAALLADLWLRDERRRRERQVLKDLPAYLDVLTLAVEAGSSLPAAVAIATAKAPPSPLRRGFERFLREVRSGRARSEALRALDERLALPPVTSLVSALLQAEKTGASLGGVLRAQGAQRTAERFARAEKLAMEAPVKMLGPLILCIFPCTFIVLAFPIGARLLADL